MRNNWVIYLRKKILSLIYGGSSKGIMGAVANAVLERNGKVIGVMPKLLTGIEHSHYGISELHETEDMHSRKKMIYAKADAALAFRVDMEQWMNYLKC